MGRSCVMLEFKGKKIMVNLINMSYLHITANEILLTCVWILILIISISTLIQLDCGIHPGMDGIDALPYTDIIDPEDIDLLLVSQ